MNTTQLSGLKFLETYIDKETEKMYDVTFHLLRLLHVLPDHNADNPWDYEGYCESEWDYEVEGDRSDLDEGSSAFLDWIGVTQSSLEEMLLKDQDIYDDEPEDLVWRFSDYS